MPVFFRRRRAFFVCNHSSTTIKKHTGKQQQKEKKVEKTMNTNIGHYFKHLTCTLIVVLGLMGIFAPVSQAATGAFAFSTATSSVDEGAGKVNITINRVGGSTGAASVSFRTNQITAVAGSDFVNIPLTTLNFAHKERQKVVSVNIINDTVVEPDETFEVLLSNPTYGTTLGKISSSVITILDNDIAPVSSTADTTAPTVSLTSPATSTTFTSAQTVTIAAAASDNIGVSKVELYEGTTLKGTDTTAPYSFAWTISSANNGNHSFTAKAYDTAGNSKVSSATAVTVNIPAATAVYEAPVLKSVSVSNGNYQLAWSLPTTTYGDPAGGYDIFVDGVDDNLHHTTLSAVKSGLPLDVEHCFVVEARWTQAIPSVFPKSNQICVKGTQSTVTSGPLKVFPSAEGYGTETRAGRGGKIIHVTNLNDSGTGSFRAAVETAGPRIVVFDVSGTIELRSNITIKEPYITIAGQTAPFPGIQLRNQQVNIQTHDLLMQHIAIRTGDTYVGDAATMHAMVVLSSSYNCVFDHVSFYWGTDECIGSYGDNLTFSNNIIAEGLDNAGHPDGPHSAGMLIMSGSDRVSIVRNLFAHHNHRSPWVKENTTVFHANNYAYNSRGTFFNFTTDRDPYTGALITAGNVYGKGPSTDIYQGLSVSSNFVSAKVFESDSLVDAASPYGILSKVVNIADKYRTSTHPFAPPTYSMIPASQVKSYIVANAGSRPAMRDAADKRVIGNLINFTGRLIDSPVDVGGWPFYSMTSKVFDAGTDPHGDNNGNGYTNVEEILHQMAAVVEGRN
jgi:hypothetical protein